jgi:hypothetical protein
MDNKWKGAILLVLVAVAVLPLAVKFAKELSEPWAKAAAEDGIAPSRPAGQGFPAWPRAFEDDPDVIGEWKTVDFVERIEDFTQGKKGWTGDFAFDQLEFMPEGRTSGPWKWTKGYLWHPGDKAEGEYVVKELNGKKYLFMEWMSGDVMIRGEKPYYYVFEKM